MFQIGSPYGVPTEHLHRHCAAGTSCRDSTARRLVPDSNTPHHNRQVDVQTHVDAIYSHCWIQVFLSTIACAELSVHVLQSPKPHVRLPNAERRPASALNQPHVPAHLFHKARSLAASLVPVTQNSIVHTRTPLMLWYPTGGGDELAILKTAALEPAFLKRSYHLLIS
jgi:hypothetical protein